MAKGINRIIKVYIGLEDLFDCRRGILQYLLTEGKTYPSDEAHKQDGDRLWDLYMASNYRQRRMDKFDVPELKLTTEAFKAAYKKRNASQFLMFYPNPMEVHLFKMIMEMEMLEDPTPSIKGGKLYVNTFPFVLDAELNALLLESLKVRFSGRFDIQLVHSDPSAFTAATYGQYNYVFKYDILIGNYEWFIKSLAETQIPDTAFFVPALFTKEDNMIVGTPEDMIYATAATLAPTVKFIPVNPSIYDYA